jgi:predicted O-methyltransferase YrrM
MNLEQALTAIAAQLNLDAAQLIAYAAGDEVGGFNFDASQSKWRGGSIWEVEGKVLYALTRALMPVQVAEFGTHEGCSATHILAALQHQAIGVLHSIDPWEGAGNRVPENLRERWSVHFHTGTEWLEKEQDATFDMLFEDMIHGVDATREWWKVALRKIRPGGLIISHDAAHFNVGADVRQGIEEAGVNATVYAIEPSDCGLAIWQAPGEVAQHEPEFLVITGAFEPSKFYVGGESFAETPTWQEIDLDDAVHAPATIEEVPTYEEMTKPEKPEKKRKPRTKKASGE